ncbi:MAG TPA: putative lipid II flippase FtsW [Methylomirabilota bacterium]|nr:putative lipid II flippase FtsW [Methylomirabilota bacterium]
MKIAVTTLAFCVAALLGLGLVMLYSSSMTRGGGHDLMMQLIWCVAGFMACVTATVLDYQLLKKLAWPIFALAIFALASVFVPHFGRASHGAHRWIAVGPMTFQPSELGKIALIIMLAWYCDRYQRQMQTFKRGILFPAALCAIILGMIFVEPDRGTTILLAAVSGAMLLIAGVRWKHIFIPAAVGAAGLAVSILHDPMRMNRIFAWLHPQDHLNGAALQAQSAMIGLGSGGWCGLGLGNGIRKFGYLPEIHTDFIFANIGEELGLIATLLVVLTFVIIAICGMRIAVNAREPFGALLAAGITLLISLQAAINIGVVTSALPNKGLPLPFISYGGSNLLAMLTCVGILFSVARHAPAREKISKSADADEIGDNSFVARATT